MITSTGNPRIKYIRKLRQKKYRRQENAYFAEGLRVTFSAVETGAPIQQLVFAPDLLSSELAFAVIDQQRASGIECLETSAEVFHSLSTRDKPVGLGAVVSSSLIPINDLAIGVDSIFAVLVDVSEPGNLGTIIRTLDAVKGSGLIIAGESVDPYHQTCVKASMGAIFSVPLSQVTDTNHVWNWLEDKGIRSVATSAHAEQVFWEVDYPLPVAIIFGSEGEGLAPDILERADRAVAIPMFGTSSSLNLAVACGLLLYELRRGLAG